jgi:putative redox protein
MATKEAAAVWKKDGLAFDASVPSGATMELNSQGAHFRPLELLMVGLAGCTAMDVIDILHKKRQAVTDFRVEAQGETAAENPHRYVKIAVKYIVTGHHLDPEAVKSAIELSEEKYCGVAASLRPGAPVTTSFEIRQAEPAAA